jgi:hypothetical protein
MAYTNKERDINDNVQVVGCFAVCIKNYPNLLTLCYEQIMPVLLNYVARGDDDLNRNVAYCLGLIV